MHRTSEQRSILRTEAAPPQLRHVFAVIPTAILTPVLTTADSPTLLLKRNLTISGGEAVHTIDFNFLAWKLGVTPGISLTFKSAAIIHCIGIDPSTPGGFNLLYTGATLNLINLILLRLGTNNFEASYGSYLSLPRPPELPGQQQVKISNPDSCAATIGNVSACRVNEGGLMFRSYALLFPGAAYAAGSCRLDGTCGPAFMTLTNVYHTTAIQLPESCLKQYSEPHCAKLYVKNKQGRDRRAELAGMLGFTSRHEMV